MNILVIGNGFDLAHELPTKYKDFLDFLEVFKTYYNNYRGNTVKMKENYFSDIILNIDTKHYDISETIIDLIENNSWLTLFENIKPKEENNIQNKGNWIDFENEISKVIQILDGINKRFNNYIYLQPEETTTEIYEKELGYLQTNIFPNLKNKINPQNRSSNIISKKNLLELSDILLSDLNRLTRCLEIYLILVSETFLKGKKKKEKLQLIETLKIDHVISFNYTDTFKILYDSNGTVKYDFIHGKISDLNNNSLSKLVLGIDEFISDDRKDKDLTFVDFKKYYQRVYKNSTCNYKDWLDEYKASKDREFNPKDIADDLLLPKSDKLKIFTFGHSIDITDKDILKRLFLDKNADEITIYYYGEESRPDKIKNLIKIIGQEAVIEYATGSNAKIKFKNQEENN